MQNTLTVQYCTVNYKNKSELSIHIRHCSFRPRSGAPESLDPTVRTVRSRALTTVHLSLSSHVHSLTLSRPMTRALGAREGAIPIESCT